jgi:maleylpyruvate isomerase
LNSAQPDLFLGRVRRSQENFLIALEVLDDAAVSRPSLLPGWTVGHVLSHVARNADSHQRRSVAAAEGLVVEQYVGGYDGRAADIDAGAQRRAVDLIDDVRTSAESLDAIWSTLAAEAWTFRVRDVAGREHVLRDMPRRRWREIEVHLVDLGVGPTNRDWSDEFVADTLPELRTTLEGRLPAGQSAPAPGLLDESDELAWLCGRLQRKDLPELLPWG